MVAIRNRSTLEASHRERRENSEYYLKSSAEMEALFAEWPEALDESARIAERCTFDLTTDLDYRFPNYEAPDGSTADAYLETICRSAARERYGLIGGAIPISVEQRLQEELRLVRKHGLSGFFLIYRDLLELSREVAVEVRGKDSARSRSGLPPGRGRGSSVGSILCYLIGLSHVDPIKYNLFLGRFLNEEIASVPDIDLDFPRDIREKLILRVYEHFGQEHAALVASFPTYKLRSAIRDVGKALGIAESELDRLAKRAGWGHGSDIENEMAMYAEYAGQDRCADLARPHRPLEADLGLPAPSQPARRRHGDLHQADRRTGAGRARRDGRPLHLPVGQGLHRRRALHQDRLPRAGHALARRGMHAS